MPSDFPQVLLEVLNLLVGYFLPHHFHWPYSQLLIQNRDKRLCGWFLYEKEICVIIFCCFFVFVFFLFFFYGYLKFQNRTAVQFDLSNFYYSEIKSVKGYFQRYQFWKTWILLGPTLDLLCIRHFMWKLYNALFWCRTLRNGIKWRVVKVLEPIFSKKVPFLASIWCCLNFLD